MCVASWAPLAVRMPWEAEKRSQGKAPGSLLQFSTTAQPCPTIHCNQGSLQHFPDPFLGLSTHSLLCEARHPQFTEKTTAIASKRARIPRVHSGAKYADFLLAGFFLQTAVSYCRSLNRLQAGSFLCSLDCHLTFQDWFIFPLVRAPCCSTPAP